MLHPRSLFPIALFISLVIFPLEGFSQPLVYSALKNTAPLVIPNKGMQAGVYSWMEIADNPSIAIPVFTVEVWVKASSGGLIVTRDISTGTPSDWQLWYEFSRKRLAFITAKSPPDSYFYTPDNSFLPNIWYHVALVVNGPSGHAYLYINGNLVISPTFTSRNFDCTTGLAWCGYYNNGGGAYLNGVIDEARYWNLERTQTQINATKDIDIPQNDRMGLVGWWRFCNSYEDYSGAGNHGTPMGNPQLVPINLPFGITCDLNPCDTVQVFITGTQGICENDSTVLTASPGFVSYLWSTGDTTQSIIARKAGWYSVEVIHGNGCVAQANFEVIVFPLPLADAGPDITVCAGVTARLGTTPHNPTWKYNWKPPVGLSNTDSARTRVQTSVTRSYLFTVTNEHGCSSSDTVLVTVQSGLDLTLPDSLHICPGSSVSLPLGVLSGFPPYSFQWSPPTSLSASDVQNPVASPSASRWYHVLVTDSMGCFSSDSIFIAITNGLETLLPDSIGICKGGSIRLPLMVRRGTPPYTFHWTLAGTLSASDVQNPVATPDSTRWYYVTVKDTLGCEGKDSILVKTGEGLRTAMPDTIFICPNTSVILPLSVSGYTGSVQFSWTPEGDLNNPHTQRPVARPGQTTTYYVHAIDSLGCEARDSVTVALFPKTDLTIIIDGAAVFCDGDSVRLLATPGFKSYRWTTPSRTIPDTGNSIIAREPGRYYITVVDANGCEVTSLPVTISTFAAFQLPVTLHGNQPLCPGDSITLETTGGYTYYLWFDDSGRVIGTGERITIGKAGKYSVIARDSIGCIGSSVPVVITVAAKPVFDITGPKLVCIGSEQVYSTLFRSRWVYQWTVTDGDIQPPDDRQAARILWARAGRMTIHLLVRDILTGCADSVTYTVDVITELHPEITADGPTIFCEGDSVLLHSREPYDLGEWADGEGRILGTGSSLIARTSGMYYFQAMTADSCSGMDSILVTVIPTPRPRILGPIEICLGDTSSYAVQNGSNAILWTFFGGKHIAGDATHATVWWDKPGNFKIIVTDTTTLTTPPCTGSDTLNIIVHPLPIVTLDAFPDTVICDGELIRLRAGTGNARYVWNTPDGLIDTTASELHVGVAGTYSVTVTTAAGCVGVSGPVTITVIPAPDANIEGPISICHGGTASYYVPVQGNVAHNWTVSGGTMLTDSTGSSIEVRWSEVGTGIVTVSLDNGRCRSFDTLLVTVGDTLTPSVTVGGPLVFCPGGEVALNAGAGYTTYTWSTPDGPISGQIIHARRPGIYTVHVVADGGCEGSSVPVQVEVFASPQPEILGPDGICPGDTALLEASPGYLSYRWSDGTTGRYCQVNNPATRSVTVIDSNGCEGTSIVHQVSLYSPPAPPIISRIGGVLQSTLATTYQWYRNDTLLTGETARECPITVPGNYAIAISNTEGCTAISDFLPVGCVTGSTVIALPHLIVNPGDTVVLDLALVEDLCMEELGIHDFEAVIRYNKTLLVPIEGTPIGRIDGNDRVIEFNSSLDALRKQSSDLRFLATLGTRDSIPLILEDFRWLDAQVAVTLINGSLRMRICREGGDRLFDSEKQLRLKQNWPNPFNATTVIEFETIESGPTQVYVLNTLGERVRTLFKSHEEAGRFVVSFDASELPSGNYTCVLQTPTVILHRVMLLIK